MMSWSRLVFHILMVSDFIVCLGSLFVFPFSCSNNLQWERERTTGVMSFTFSMHQILLFTLGLCFVFHSRAPTTCCGREREGTTGVMSFS